MSANGRKRTLPYSTTSSASAISEGAMTAW